MRLLVHRGQVLLLLVVGLLAGVAIAGVCLEMDGISVLGLLKVNELLAPPRSQLPTEIVIGRAAPPSNDGGQASSTAAQAANGSTPDNAVPVAAQPAAAQPAAAPPGPVYPAPTTSVVPAAVYTYPPPTDDHGGGSGGGRGGPSPTPGSSPDGGHGGH
jgi:hypothetical protein